MDSTPWRAEAPCFVDEGMDRIMTDLIVRLRHLAEMGLEIAAEAADAIETSRGAVEPMRAALAWYAEPGNWRRPTRGRSWSNAPAADDRGSRARMVMLEQGAGQG